MTVWDSVGQRPTVSWAKHTKGGTHFSLVASFILPDFKNALFYCWDKRETYVSPADLSRIPARHIMYFNRASLITWDC